METFKKCLDIYILLCFYEICCEYFFLKYTGYEAMTSSTRVIPCANYFTILIAHVKATNIFTITHDYNFQTGGIISK